MSSGVLDQLDEQARRHADAVAVVEVDGEHVRQLTRGQLMARAGALAATVRRHVPEGGVVMIRSGNCIELPVALLGTWLADRVAFAVSPDLTCEELKRAAETVGAAALIADAAHLSIPWFLPITQVMEQADSPRASCGHRGALLLQSSGTTGMPRIVRREMAALTAVSDNCSEALAIGRSDRMLMALPMHHSYGLEHGVLACLASGATLEVHRRFEPHAMLTALTGRSVTLMPGVPFMFDVLSQLGAGRVRTSLRLAYSAGSALPPAVFDAFTSRFNQPLGQIYGATEFGSVTFNDPHGRDFDPHSVGRPLRGVTLRMADPDDTGQGHITVRAPSMLSGYADAGPLATRDGFVQSGDLGHVDSAGRLHVTGRLKLIIDVGGPKVNPLEVEAVLVQHPCVHEAVVVPAPISATVTRLRAVVTLRPGAAATEANLRDFARARLSRYKVPRYFDIRETLPRTATGKVLRQALACS